MSSIDRKPHCLKKEKTLAMPRHIIFFDCETKPERTKNGAIKQRLKLGWAVYYRKSYGRNLDQYEWFNFNDAVSFWAFVDRHTERKRKLWLLARNIVFDFTVVKGWKNLRQMGFKLKFFHNTGTCTIISVRGERGSIVFLDIMNWFVESLAKTGQRIGMPKLKIDFETCTDEYLNTYCKRDLEIELKNFKLFVKFLEDNSVSRLCYTKASTAMAAYLLRHYDSRIYIHNNKQAIDLERESYRGGRVECFYLGDLNSENYYILDVNSLYPFVMRNNQYPTKYNCIVNNPDKKTWQKALQNGSVIAKVLIDTDEPTYAVRRDRTIFPIGRFWVTLTTPELKYALEHNHILKIEQAVFYEQADIFSTYVDRFYKLRQEFKSANVPEYVELCKKFLNTLYGKFGQKADEWEKIGDCPDEPDRVELCFTAGVNRVKQIRYLLGEIFELVGRGECYNSFPAISSQITADARMYLYKLMKQAKFENVFYCDTDSLIVNEVGLCNLQSQIDNVKLGYLKIVETSQRLTIRGLKDYTTEAKNVIKGIRKNAVEIRTGVYEQEQWPSFKGLLRSGEVNTYTIKKTTKVLSRAYTKGHVSPDGFVSPFALDESFEHSQQLC